MCSWYLRSMGEKPLAEYVAADRPQAFRILTYIRPSHARPYWVPVVVRLRVDADGSGEVVVKAAHDDHHPDNITLRKTGKVSRPAVKKFLSLLGKSDFWTARSEMPFDIQHVSMGGVDWLIEGERGDAYHAVDRDPLAPGRLRDAELFLLTNLAKLQLQPAVQGPRTRSK